MTIPSEGQKKAMGDILRAMNAVGNPELPSASHSSSQGALVSGTDEAKKAAMGNIMKMFREATDNVREAAHENHYLMEALQTERTETGVRISEWEIVISEQSGRPGKFYDVIRDDITIASDLRLYEAALLLTQELNKGASITSPAVKEILRLEEDFSKNLDDAARYAKLAKTAKGEKAMVFEARYSDARAKAIRAKEEIKRVR